MRKFSSAVVTDPMSYRPNFVQYNRPTGYYPPATGRERFYVLFDDGDGWNVFVEVDNKINADLITKALNAKEMKDDVDQARILVEALTQPVAPPSVEERLAQLENQVESIIN